MATNPKSWGILGNPSKEKIEQYTNMPVGSFRNMVKNLSRGKKGKVMQEYQVHMTKRRVDLTYGTITVHAFDWQGAYEVARTNADQISWDEQPYKTGVEELVYQSRDPKKYA